MFLFLFSVSPCALCIQQSMDTCAQYKITIMIIIVVVVIIIIIITTVITSLLHCFHCAALIGFILSVPVVSVPDYGTITSPANSTTDSLNTDGSDTTSYSPSTDTSGTSAYSPETDSAGTTPQLPFSEETTEEQTTVIGSTSSVISTVIDGVTSATVTSVAQSTAKGNVDTTNGNTETTLKNKASTSPAGNNAGTTDHQTSTGSNVTVYPKSKNNSPKQDFCHCRCVHETSSTAALKSQAEKAARETAKALHIAASSTGSYTRKKTSAPDDRPSARSSGIIAMAFLITVGILIMLPDVVTAIRAIKTLTRAGGRIKKKPWFLVVSFLILSCLQVFYAVKFLRWNRTNFGVLRGWMNAHQNYAGIRSARVVLFPFFQSSPFTLQVDCVAECVDAVTSLTFCRAVKQNRI